MSVVAPGWAFQGLDNNILAEIPEALNPGSFYGNVKTMVTGRKSPGFDNFAATLACGFLAFFITVCAYANPSIQPAPPVEPGTIRDSTIDNPFDEAYWGFELTRNIPLSRSREDMTAGNWQPMVFYRYRLSTGWLLGAHAGFKELTRKAHDDGRGKFVESSAMPVLSIGYESLRGWRLYHPVYLFGGGKFQYLLPAEKATFPLRRNEDYRAEFGIAGVLMLAVKPAGNWLITLRADRWRGTATTLLQGQEFAAGVLVNL
ncbi:MAG: hypothetical protein RIQ81_411 [Pseudomonadota bacterium]|jgi:hypothetical protein